MRTLLLPLILLWTAGIAACADRTYKLPCEIDSFSPSGDGTTVWIACFAPVKTPPESNHRRPSMVYALDTATGRLADVAHATGSIRVEAAPIGERAVIVLPEERSNGKALLFDGIRQTATLSIDPSLIKWSADAKQIFFYGGSTIQADAWDILGSLQLDGLKISRTKLAEPTEPVYVCPQSGHIFTGVVSMDGAGRLKPNAATEYDAALHRIGRNSKIPPGEFSATCRFVATPSSAHGPVPWEIVDTTSGRRLFYSEFTADGKKREYEFNAWNPALDGILLRTLYRPAAAEKVDADLEVFDVVRQRVVDSVASFSGPAAWSHDGKWLIRSSGQSLIFHGFSMSGPGR